MVAMAFRIAGFSAVVFERPYCCMVSERLLSMGRVRGRFGHLPDCADVGFGEMRCASVSFDGNWRIEGWRGVEMVRQRVVAAMADNMYRCII